MSRADVETLSGIFTIAGVGVCVASLIALHLLPTGLSPLRNPVSQYGITKYRIGDRIQTIAMGIAAIAAAIGIDEVDVQGCTVVVVLLLAFGAARLGISWFPMDVPGGARTDTGRRHGLLAIVAFACASFGALRLGEILNNANLWVYASTAITTVGVVMVATLFAMGVTRQHEAMRRYFGLIERVFYVSTIVFLVVLGTQLAGRS